MEDLRQGRGRLPRDRSHVQQPCSVGRRGRPFTVGHAQIRRQVHIARNLCLGAGARLFVLAWFRLGLYSVAASCIPVGPVVLLLELQPNTNLQPGGTTIVRRLNDRACSTNPASQGTVSHPPTAVLAPDRKHFT